MSLISIIILVLFTCFLAVIFLIFYIKNRDIKQKHLQEISLIRNSVLIHEKQINDRDRGLCSYNFLKYNLDESLKVQPEINLF